MKPAARHRDDYSPRQIEAARRVLVDMGQVLAAFEDCVVIIGGWVPDLLLANAEEPHIGSIDVDIALDVKKLGGDRYASMLQMLLHTGRYRAGAQPFQFIVDVDLADGGKSLEVELEFLAPKEARIARHRPKLLKGFRVLLADGCSSAFHAPSCLGAGFPHHESPCDRGSRQTEGYIRFLLLSPAFLRHGEACDELEKPDGRKGCPSRRRNTARKVRGCGRLRPDTDG
jgi:hypothetical protein